MNIIDYQIREALSKYPDAVPTNSAITAVFPKRQDLTIVVNFAENFPMMAPTITIYDKNGQKVDVQFPIIKYWCPHYTICDCLDQAKIYTDIPSLNQHQVNNNEINDLAQRMPPQDVANPATRTRALCSMPSLGRAVNEQKVLSSKIPELQDKVKRDTDKMDILSSEYKSLSKQQENFQQQKAQMSGPQAMNEAYRYKLEWMKNSYNQYRARSDQIIQAYKNGQVDYKTFIRDFYANKTEEELCFQISEYLQANPPM